MIANYLSEFSILGLVLFLLSTFIIVGQAFLFIAYKTAFKFHKEERFAPTAMSALNGLFSLIIAFVTIAVWEDHGNISNMIGKEANCIYNIYRTLDAYPPNVRESGKEKLGLYVTEVVEKEWPLMKTGKPDHEAIKRLKSFHDSIIFFKPTDNGEIVGHQEVLKLMSEYRELRRNRVMSTKPLIGYSVWVLLSISSLLYSLILCLLNMPSYRSHAIYIGFYSALLSVPFTLLILVNNPFNGPDAIGPEPFKTLLDYYWKLP
jgi:Protein of unknown function (DUF4239)